MEEKDKITDHDEPLYTIGTVAEILNVSVQTLRAYERERLIIPFKKASHHRLYSMNDIERLRCIRRSITERKFSIPALKNMYALIPCWDIKPCTVKEQEECEAYNSSLQPCWSFTQKVDGCNNQDCRTCNVYKNFINCEQIKNSIKNISRKK